MAPLSRQVVTSLGLFISLPAFKGRDLRGNVFSLSPGATALPAATNHYVDINTAMCLTLLILQNTSARKMCRISPRSSLMGEPAYVPRVEGR